MTIEGLTISDIIRETGKTRPAVAAWISRHGVKPIIPEFLYPLDTLDKIKESKRGRPSKPKPSAQ